MKKAIAAICVGLALAGVAASGGYANSTMMSSHSMHAHGLKCPYCGMVMPTHKTAMMSVPIKIKGVTYYCCKSCHPKPKHM